MVETTAEATRNFRLLAEDQGTAQAGGKTLHCQLQAGQLSLLEGHHGTPFEGGMLEKNGEGPFGTHLNPNSNLKYGL